jgi:hypothetical protein
VRQEKNTSVFFDLGNPDMLKVSSEKYLNVLDYDNAPGGFTPTAAAPPIAMVLYYFCRCGWF